VACVSRSSFDQPQVVNKTWPLPALLAWAACWAVFIGLSSLGVDLMVAMGAGAATGAALSLLGSTPWRRVFIALGFPLSLAASGLASALPAWGWLLPLGLLALVYPMNAWRDAPLFPTPAGGLQGLALLAVLPADARVLDAGCGLGAGLRELQREYPTAHLEGMEWSWPLRWACALRCRFARVRRADIWAADWSTFDLVYLFQRPESMARAWEKARRELRSGSWMASLEFEVAGQAPQQTLQCPDGRVLWLYRCPAGR
jgi:SAM-dependent methyltransferase